MNVRVTTVSREESTIGESPAAVFVITQEMIHRSGATSIPEALRMAPGVNVAKSSANQWVVGIRGFDNTLNNKMLVQIDGRTLYSPIQAGVFWDSVDYLMEDIDRIEVIRGPGGSVWGANSVNGVINIVTKPAKDTQGLLFTIGGGTEERGFTGLRFGGMIGKDIHYRLYGKWFERDKSFNPLGFTYDDWRSGRAGGRMEWTPTSNDTITFQGDWFNTVSGVAATTTTKATDRESRGGDVLGRWTHQISKESNWQLQAYWDRYEQRTHSGSSKFSTDTYDVDFQHLFPIGERQKFIYGFAYRFQQNMFAGTGITTIDNETNVFSGFLQDEIALVPDRLTLMLGSKFEHNDYNGFEWQPSGRLLWTPTKRQSMWLSVSRAVRTPDLLENDFTIKTGGVSLITPNTNLRSEEVVAYELGYRIQATNRLSFDTAVFYNNYTRLSVFGPVRSSAVIPLQFQNGMRGETYGAEISAAWKPTDWWKLSANYSYLKLNLHADQNLSSSIRAIAEATEKQSPQNNFYLRSSFDLPQNVNFDLTLRYVDQLPGYTTSLLGSTTVNSGVEPYLTLDARLAWKPTKNLEIAVVGQNLLGNHYEYVATTKIEVERGVYGQVTLHF